MEERNELNDIILNRSGNSAGSKKKIILAIGVLATILIAVIMIMKTSVSNGTDNLPQAQQGAKSNLPPQPPVPQANQDKQSDDPLFQPVEIVKENNKSDEDLDKIAQKLKQESLTKDNPPVASQATTVADNTPATVQKVDKNVPATSAENKKDVEQKTVVKKEQPITVASNTPKETSKKEQPVKKESPAKKETPMKKEQPVKKESLFSKIATPKKEIKKEAETTASKQEGKQESSKSVKTSPDGKYYVQVGSFTKSPGDKFFNTIKKLGYEYQSNKVNNADKITVGPFKNETDAREALKALRKDVESGAFITKK